MASAPSWAITTLHTPNPGNAGLHAHARGRGRGVSTISMRPRWSSPREPAMFAPSCNAVSTKVSHCSRTDGEAALDLLSNCAELGRSLMLDAEAAHAMSSIGFHLTETYQLERAERAFSETAEFVIAHDLDCWLRWVQIGLSRNAWPKANGFAPRPLPARRFRCGPVAS